jgi:hypothetical protein
MMDNLTILAELRGFLEATLQQDSHPILPYEALEAAHHRSGRIAMAKQVYEKLPKVDTVTDAQTGRSMFTGGAFDF